MKVEIPPEEWNDHALEDLEFKLELWTESEANAELEDAQAAVVSKLEVYASLPKLEKRIAEIVADPDTRRCCDPADEGLDGWTTCAHPGTICPLFLFSSSDEGDPYWRCRSRVIKVRAFLKQH